MKKYILIIVGTIVLLLLGIEIFYESPVVDGDDIFIEDNLGIDMPNFNLALDSTAELSPKVQRILGLYIPYILSNIEDTCFAIDLRVSRRSNNSFGLSVEHVAENEYEDGIYCGASRYNGRVIRLWGENIDEFWTATHIPIEILPDTNYYATYDRCSWWLYIDMDNQKICPDSCLFFCGFPFSNDTLINLW